MDGQRGINLAKGGRKPSTPIRGIASGTKELPYMNEKQTETTMQLLEEAGIVSSGTSGFTLLYIHESIICLDDLGAIEWTHFHAQF